jgi:LAO/AO transport system kinase
MMTASDRGPVPGPPPPASLLDGVLAGNPRALGRAISLLESGAAGGVALLRELYPRGGRAAVVGLTGPPGAGKSSLIEGLALHLLADGARVAVVAVDPSSPFTGGALLGDRIRMQSLFLHPRAFIRSMATRGAMGGLSAVTLDAVDILDAAGFDWVLVETVGVGQDEVDVAAAVRAVALVLVPGMGDDIQALKAGVMEIADLFVVNKADRDGADRTVADLEALARLGGEGRPPRPVVRTVATEARGIAGLAERLAEVMAGLADPDAARAKAERQAEARLTRLLSARLLARARQGAAWGARLRAVAQRREDPYSACDAILKEVLC